MYGCWGMLLFYPDLVKIPTQSKQLKKKYSYNYTTFGFREQEFYIRNN